ncbi:MAG: DUF255 domain-containing protein [Planctomycetota bacterium]|jgi:YHS domain-containing protein|nr:DUF255 domain-containing protein [Planctomycetota bacterium]
MYSHKLLMGGLFCLLIASIGNAEAKENQIRWRRDMKQAYKESQATGKPMFVQFTAGWCGVCKKMEKSTFSDPQVIEFVNETFIPLLVDKDQNEKFSQAVGLEGLPTTVIISSELEMTSKLKGFQSSWELTRTLSSYQRQPPESATLVKNEVAPASRDPNVRTAAATPPASARPAGEPRLDNSIAPSAYDRMNEDSTEATSDDFVSDNFESDDEPLAEEKLPPVAFDGHCLVSALDDRQLVKGLPEFGVVYRGRTVFFATTAHREEFMTNPNTYWPANDGYCAASEAETGEVKPGLLQHATVYHKHLWLFADDESRDRFMKHPQEYSEAVQDQNRK